MEENIIMADVNNIVKLAVDTYRGVQKTYSTGESFEVLRNALIEANGGKDHISVRDVRDGKCAEVFAIVETILAKTLNEGLKEDDFFNALVEYRNVAEGDANEFVVEDSSLYVVSETADGTQGVRRQRIVGSTAVTIPTIARTVRVYDELNRVLAGRTSLTDMINRVGESFRQHVLNDVYALWTGATATQLGGATYFPTAGTYDEDALLDLISHVEAAAGGRVATIVGTKKALRALTPSITGTDINSDLYNLGYVGKFYGTPVVMTPQRHKIGSDDFIMDDDTLHIIAGDDKPIKYVTEGDPIVIPGDPLGNADLTQEYFYAEKYGMGIVLAGGNSGFGRYEMTT